MNGNGSIASTARPPRTDLTITGLLLVVVIGGWAILVELTGFNSIVMPSPVDVARTAVNSRTEYTRALLLTSSVGITGLIIGSVLGSVLAVMAWLWRSAEGAVTSVALIVRSVPIVIFIPLFAHLLGFNLRMVVLTVSLLSFFPAFVLVSSGLKSLPGASLDIGHVWGATRPRILLFIALPAAVPKLFTAIRLSSARAVLAAMVAEFLTGIDGLGKVFLLARSDLQSARAWAAAIIAAAASLVLFRTSEWLERTMSRRMGYTE